MKLLDSLIKGIDGIFTTLATSVLITLMMFGVYALYDIYTVYNSGQLPEEILTLKPTKKNDYFDLTSLQKINEDIIGWINITETNIDYPILHGKDNSEYLSKNFKKEYAATGSIFLDYRNDKLEDNYSIIYGHNMNANLMFGDIKRYKDKVFFNNHLQGYLYTIKGKYKLTIMAYSMVSAYDDKVYDLLYNKNNHNYEILNYFRNTAMYTKNIEIEDSDRLLLLSTCDAAGINERSVLLAKISKHEEEIIEDKQQEVKEEKVIEKEEKKKHINYKKLILPIMVFIVIIIYAILIIRVKKQKKKKTNKKEEIKE